MKSKPTRLHACMGLLITLTAMYILREHRSNGVVVTIENSIHRLVSWPDNASTITFLLAARVTTINAPFAEFSARMGRYGEGIVFRYQP